MEEYDDLIGKSFSFDLIEEVEDLPEELLPYVDYSLSIEPLTGEALSVVSPPYTTTTYYDTIKAKANDILIFQGQPFYYKTLHDPIENPDQTNPLLPNYYYDPDDSSNVGTDRNYAKYYKKCHYVSFKYNSVSKTGFLIKARKKVNNISCVAGSTRLISSSGDFTSTMQGKYISLSSGTGKTLKIISFISNNEVDLEYCPTILERDPDAGGEMTPYEYRTNISGAFGYVNIDTDNPLVDTPTQVYVAHKSSVYEFAIDCAWYDWSNITDWNMFWQYYGWKYLVYWDSEYRYLMGFEPKDNASIFLPHNFEKEGDSSFAKIYVMPDDETTWGENGRTQYRYKGELPSGNGSLLIPNCTWIFEEGYENGTHYVYDYSPYWYGQDYYVPKYVPNVSVEITRNYPDILTKENTSSMGLDVLGTKYVEKIGENKYRFSCSGRIYNLISRSKNSVVDIWKFPKKQEKWTFYFNTEDNHYWTYYEDGDWHHGIVRTWEYGFTKNYTLLDYEDVERLYMNNVGNEVNWKVILKNPAKYQEVRKYRIH